MEKMIKFLRIVQPIRVIDWDKITIQNFIGKGSYGSVKSVTIPNNQNSLAMKIIQIEECSSEEESERQYEYIHREIQLLQSCNHPNILSLYGITINMESNPIQIGLLTPLYWGSLARLLTLVSSGQMKKEDFPNGIEFNNEIKQKIIFGITAGLFYLHSRNIIHRDIKPENILLDENFNPVLCDFGFAKETYTKKTVTQTNRLGTTVYKAPELILEAKYSEKVDIYAWAIVINSILKGEKAWKQFEKDPYFTDVGFFLKVKEGLRPDLIQGKEYKIYQELIQRGWSEFSKERPKIQEIIDTLMKKEALLPNVDPKKMKEYEKDVLKKIPEFSISLFEKLEKIEFELEKQSNELRQIHTLLSHLERQQCVSNPSQNDTSQILQSDPSQNDSPQILQSDPSQINSFQITEFEAKYENDSNHKNDPNFTKLHFAAKIDDAKIGELLIAKGADINTKNKEEYSPLHIAAKKDSIKMGELLIAKGADINAKDKNGRTPLHIAAQNDANQIGQLLVSKGADINAKTSGGETPLYYAIYGDSVNMAELLISKGADVNAKDLIGKAPLHYAVHQNSIKIGELLISHGADINALNILRETPLTCARNPPNNRPRSVEMEQFLISHGAK